jgi:phage-related protein
MECDVQILDRVVAFIESLDYSNQAKIMAAIRVMKSGDFETVYTKQLAGPIRELKVKQYRLLYFIHKHTMYFVGGFTKKSTKTPKQEIENAQQLYKLIIK